jgi:hypothetical protein
MRVGVIAASTVGTASASAPIAAMTIRVFVRMVSSWLLWFDTPPGEQ